ncbi:M3 family metallopeptidase [uncultured Prevotella sp.]|uniref:M3 family metallopeptidase n=1 Tax=uncultured Prevotella sp. TaxID=159272 RepID=UPI002592EE81|nr:M3 family metallopeptidase [uncultured Prevotella sp.]
MDKNIEKAKNHINPFLHPYGTPHDAVPFDRIELADYEEAMMEGIRRDNESIDRIVNNPDEPTFENTIIPEDEVKGRKHYYDLLDRVTTVFFNLLSAESNDDLEALAQKMSPILTRHANDVSLNPKLFARIKYVHDHHRELTPEESMLLEKSYDGFVRSGALLDEKGKQRLRELTEEASRLSLTFSQNLLKENKAFELNITDEAQLDGLPESVRETAAETARERGEKGWVFTLDAPSYVPFMMYSSQRDLRKKMYMARATQGTHDNGNSNIEVCKRLINLRREMAQLLGYKTYADYVMKYRMASNVKNVYKLLDDLIENYKPTALNEQADIQALARKLEGDDFEVMPWDSSYYSHKLKLERFDLDPEMLRPYLEVSNVIKGVFGLATRLYGITFKERNDIPVYNPDVRTYEVSDTDGSYLALLYVDFHPRKGKQDGAWMTEYQGQWIERDGTNVRPHVSLVMNLSRPTADKPALLNLSEVETFLHEFGHSLHGMFANTRFESLSGTNVWWDFVEMPSQFMENYAVEKDFLHTFAFHYKTGEPMPDELIDKVVASRNFNAASACLRQVSFGLLDMAYYTLTEPFTANLMEFEKKAWAKAIITKQLPDTCMTTQFSHIMAGGYAAGYYSYKWAEVLDADVFSVFKKNGIFDRKTAQSFRDNILSRGGTEHPMVLYKRFRGQEPTIDALLERDGIKKGDDK